MSRRLYDRWRDVDDVHIPDLCRVEQIAVAKEHGALPARLHKCGEVRRARHQPRQRAVRRRGQGRQCPPHLVRVLDTPDGAR